MVALLFQEDKGVYNKKKIKNKNKNKNKKNRKGKKECRQWSSFSRSSGDGRAATTWSINWTRNINAFNGSALLLLRPHACAHTTTFPFFLYSCFFLYFTSPIRQSQLFLLIDARTDIRLWALGISRNRCQWTKNPLVPVNSYLYSPILAHFLSECFRTSS